MLPFLFIATRPEPAAADEEYELFQRRLGVPATNLVRIRLDQQPLPEHLDIANYSGIVLAGGPFNSSTSEDDKSPTQLRIESELRTLVSKVLAADFPFFGACYGVSTLGTALGATVSRTAGETASATTITLTPAGSRDPLLAGVSPSFFGLVAHTEGCVDTPPGAVLLASGEHCKVQMFRVLSNVYATQFHPEADGTDFLRRMTFYMNSGYFAPEQYDAIKQSFAGLDLSEPARMLSNFVSRYATDVPHIEHAVSGATVFE